MTAIYSVDLRVLGQPFFYPALTVLELSEDVIVHWGMRVAPVNAPPAEIGAHTVQLLLNGQPASPVYNVPFLAWNSEYHFALAPDTIIRSPADMYVQGLMLPIGPLVKGVNPSPSANVYKAPGDLAGLSVAMGSTGQRQEIGVVTEPAANFLGFTGDPAPVVAITRALTAFPSFIFDETQGGMLFDKVKNPKASIYVPRSYNPPRTASDFVSPPPQTMPDGSPILGNFPRWDAAHTPEAGYIAFCITGKRRYLRILQAYANQAVLWSTNKGFANPFEPSVQVDQTRGWARGHNNIMLARRATELAEQMGLDLKEYGLQASSYFKQICDNDIAFVRKYYMADPAIQAFRFWPISTYQSPWQQDYVGQVLGLHVFLYPGEIDDLYLWDLGNLIPRVNGKSGWPPCIQSVYRLNVAPKYGNAPSTHPSPFTTTASDYVSGWGAAFATLKDAKLYETDGIGQTAADFAAAAADPYNKDTWSGVNIDYPQQAFARLSIAMFLDSQGIIDVSGTWPDLKQAYAHQFAMLKNSLAKGKAAIPPARISFLPNPPGSFPNPIPPPTTTPPVGGISMPQTATLNPGQTKTLPLIVTPANGDLKTLAYMSADPTVVTVRGVAGGVQITYVKDGASQVFADVNGADAAGQPVKVEAICDVICATPIPLVTGLAFGPAS